MQGAIALYREVVVAGNNGNGASEFELLPLLDLALLLHEPDNFYNHKRANNAGYCILSSLRFQSAPNQEQH